MRPFVRFIPCLGPMQVILLFLPAKDFALQRNWVTIFFLLFFVVVERSDHFLFFLAWCMARGQEQSHRAVGVQVYKHASQCATGGMGWS